VTLLESGEIRRRLLRTIAQAKAGTSGRRERVDAAGLSGREVLVRLVVPLVKVVASVLVVESYRCSVSTPEGAVRLSFEPGGNNYIEFVLDTNIDPPALVGHTCLVRGNRVIEEEQIVAVHPSFSDLDDKDILLFVLRAVVPFVAR
jgi:hypothetical protein